MKMFPLAVPALILGLAFGSVAMNPAHAAERFTLSFPSREIAGSLEEAAIHRIKVPFEDGATELSKSAESTFLSDLLRLQNGLPRTGPILVAIEYRAGDAEAADLSYRRLNWLRSAIIAKQAAFSTDRVVIAAFARARRTRTCGRSRGRWWPARGSARFCIHGTRLHSPRRCRRCGGGLVRARGPATGRGRGRSRFDLRRSADHACRPVRAWRTGRYGRRGRRSSPAAGAGDSAFSGGCIQGRLVSRARPSTGRLLPGRADRAMRRRPPLKSRFWIASAACRPRRLRGPAACCVTSFFRVAGRKRCRGGLPADHEG